MLDIYGRNEFKDIKNILKENGIYLLASFKTKKIIQALWSKLFGNKKLICALSHYSIDDLFKIKKLAEERKIFTIIDKVFPIEQIVEAHRYMESDERKGNVILKF